MANEPMTNNSDRPVKEEEIDLLELARKLWDARKRIIKWCCIGAVVGLVVAFSIPKEYSVTVKLAPEITNRGSSMRSLGGLAAMAGINFVGSSTTGDAFSPEFYPDIFESVPFVTDLFNVEVSSLDGELQTTVYDYVSEELRAPWWSAVIRAPFRVLGWVVSLFLNKEEEIDHELNPFQLTKDETGVYKVLRERVLCNVDKKTAMITVTVTMQDPLIAATLTDTVMRNLQNYITEYRTNKARHDLEFTQKLHDEAQESYYEAQSRYARYMDANQSVVLRSVRTEQERLQNEMNLRYSLYNQMAQQLQAAQAKVQESTPVYAVLQPATVPVKASKPSKMLTLIGFTFLFGMAISAWVLFGEDLFAQFKQQGPNEA